MLRCPTWNITFIAATLEPDGNKRSVSELASHWKHPHTFPSRRRLPQLAVQKKTKQIWLRPSGDSRIRAVVVDV